MIPQMTPLIALHLQAICQSMVLDNFGTDNSTGVVVDTTMLPEGYKPFPDAGVAYKFSIDDNTWNSARKRCIDEGSNLAVVDSFAKYKFIRGMIPKSCGPHVGIHKLFDDTEWVSVTTGTTPTDIPWASANYNQTSGRKCAAMWKDDSGLGADDCTHMRPYVCEIPYRVSDGSAKNRQPVS